MYQPYYFKNKAENIEVNILQQAARMVRAGEEWEPMVRTELAIQLNLEYEKYTYRQKLVKFKETLQGYNKEIENYAENVGRNHVFNFNDSRGKIVTITIPMVWESYDTLVEKQTTLRALVKATELFLETGNIYLKRHVELLESYLWPFESAAGWLYDIEPFTKGNVSFSDFKNQYISKLIRRRLGKIFFRIVHDLRFHFRTIIKFLFKNMDDESGDTVLFRTAAINTVSFKNLSSHEQYRNYFSFSRAA